jgi:hypothetical protein
MTVSFQWMSALPPGSRNSIRKVRCWVCKRRDLLGLILWKNAKTGKVRYTGLTCYERVVDRLNWTEEKKQILLWVARNRKKFEGRGWLSLEQSELVRLLSYKRPLSSAYGGRWEKAVDDIWKCRKQFPMSEFELGLLKTLHNHRGKFWVVGSPTPRQRRFLDKLLIRFWNWRRDKVATS